MQILSMSLVAGSKCKSLKLLIFISVVPSLDCSPAAAPSEISLDNIAVLGSKAVRQQILERAAPHNTVPLLADMLSQPSVSILNSSMTGPK